MEFSTLDIILVVIALASVAAAVVVRVRAKKTVMRAMHRMDGNYSERLERAENETRRVTALYEDLKRRKDNAHQSDKSQNVLENSAQEQLKLKIREDELSERNRQLWDVSVSIEKERLHIQSLKDEIEAQHHDVMSSIRYAKLIQNAVLPSEEILKESFLDVFLFWRPRDVVSGDFYWMKRIGSKVIFTVADCTGHGVPGAFMSMLGVAFLNEICVGFTRETTPAMILEELRKKIITTLKQSISPKQGQKDGMDMALCILDSEAMEMRFAGANSGMYLVRGSQLTEYKAVHNPVGIYPHLVPFENRDVDIQHGDYVYLFSDGFSDQFCPACQKFTPRRFKALLSEINGKTKSAIEQSEMLVKALDDWRQDFRQLDDILVGGYRIK
ncbi:MAG: serine/threonine-protein phosphatase [Bacteroidales bacterium]|nr:serine/threonine-protein phosphatase [Bacteroidales bacterium]